MNTVRTRKFFLATAAAIGTLAVMPAFADDWRQSIAADPGVVAMNPRMPLTREQVRADLREARAQGLMEPVGAGSTPDAVLMARELANETQARVLEARMALAAERLAQVHNAEQMAAAPMAADEASAAAADTITVAGSGLQLPMGISAPFDIATYVEQGPDGPVLVVIELDGRGAMARVESYDLASID